MLKEEGELGFISLKRFYIRRALRILPVYLACIVVMVLIQILGLSAQDRTTWLRLFTFTRNFYQTDHIENLISGHFWSFSVEEQFYFIWPVVFLLLGRSGGRIYFLISMIVFSIGFKIIALLGCYNRHLYFLFGQSSSFLYLDCLSYGCIGAILLHTSREKLELFFGRYSVLNFSLSCLFLLVPGIVGLGMGMQSFGFICLLLQSVLFSESRPFKILNNRWMVKIGILSYSLYVWQLIIFILWPLPKLWFFGIPVTFGVAWIFTISWRSLFFFAFEISNIDNGLGWAKWPGLRFFSIRLT